MSEKLKTALTWFALPIYIWQGLAVRRRTFRAPPPLPQTIDPVPGNGEKLDILLIGDSSAAGVGVNRIEDSLGGQLVSHLNKQSGRPVNIRIAGSNSATAGHIRDIVLPNIERHPYTHIILNIGTNDSKNFHRVRRFYKEFGTLLYALHARFPDARLIWSGILDLSQVPSLPTPLNKILGIRSRALMEMGACLCRERFAEIPEAEWNPVRENFSADGFHASERGYQEWAKGLADHILKSSNP